MKSAVFHHLLKSCRLCPRRCGVDRLSGAVGACLAGLRPKLALAELHHWEEPCLSGTRGSGAVFFSHCSLRCLFCQNHAISQGGFGKEVTEERLSEIFLELEARGAHNINLVSPTHYLPQVAGALARARRQGLTLPVVYNSSGYEEVEALRHLEGLVDIYLPDCKYADDGLARRYSAAPSYFEAATSALQEMLRQVGTPALGRDGIMRRGLMIRHLVLPGHLENTRRVLAWIADHLPKEVYLSLMAQYTPLHRASEVPELNRRLTPEEYEAAVSCALDLGLEHGYLQELEAAVETWVPRFDLRGVEP
ncbi:MAG: radical SAM protein [Bacillota bacterium]|nr:radical SAM protein [Bacillota bacterium]